MRDSFARVEDHSNRISQAPKKDPHNSSKRDMGINLSSSDNAEPSHGHIGGDRKDRKAVREPQFEENPKRGDGPDHREQCPAPASAQVDQEKRRVSAGDEQQDGAVVKDVQGALCSWRRDRVVEGRSCVEADKRRSIDSAAENLPGAAAHKGEGKQKYEAENAAGETYAVGERVGQFIGSDLAPYCAGPREHGFRVPRCARARKKNPFTLL